jgi:hypothetical protein
LFQEIVRREFIQWFRDIRRRGKDNIIGEVEIIVDLEGVEREDKVRVENRNREKLGSFIIIIVVGINGGGGKSLVEWRLVIKRLDGDDLLFFE